MAIHSPIMKLPMKRLLNVCILIVAMSSVDKAFSQPLNMYESNTIFRLQSKKPPVDKENSFNELSRKNQALADELHRLQIEKSKVMDEDLASIEADIDFFKKKALRFETLRNSILQEAIKTMTRAKILSQNLYDAVADNQNSKIFFHIGLPVFKRSHELKSNGESPFTLIVDLSRTVATKTVATVGEILTVNKGTAQFAIVKNNKGKFTVHTVGEMVTIDDNDFDASRNAYAKHVFFQTNFQAIMPGDYIAVIVSQNAGITFDDMGTAHSLTIPVKDIDCNGFSFNWENKPEQFTKTFKHDENIPWQGQMSPQRIGKAFSFNMLGDSVD